MSYMSHVASKVGEFTFADYMRWPESERWQLLDGQAFAMAPPSWAHQSVVTEVGRQLGNALQGKPCQARVAPVGVRLPVQGESDAQTRTVFEPDILVVCDPSKIDAKGVRGAPDVIIEVLSPSTASFDQIQKRKAYEAAGVRELWLVDVANGVLTIYRQTGTVFDPPDIVQATGVVALRALPGVNLDLNFIDALRVDLE
jgi:Uma2 family endonuclease